LWTIDELTHFGLMVDMKLMMVEDSLIRMMMMAHAIALLVLSDLAGVDENSVTLIHAIELMMMRLPAEN
jgi:hypothetical protein